MATDPVTSPITTKGAWIFGAGIGALVVVIRVFGGLPEGVMYAILIMNALVPLIDRGTQPRVFGTGAKADGPGRWRRSRDAGPRRPPDPPRDPRPGLPRGVAPPRPPRRPQKPPPATWKLVGVLAGGGAVAGLFLVLAYLGTIGSITAHKQQVLADGVREVLGLAPDDPYDELWWKDDRLHDGAARGRRGRGPRVARAAQGRDRGRLGDARPRAAATPTRSA